MKYTISEKKLKELTGGWDVVNNKLQKKFKLKTYKEVIDLVNNIAEIAEEQDHHPKMVIGYDNLLVEIFDHEKDKISDKCYKFAKEVNKLTPKKITESTVVIKEQYDSEILCPKDYIVRQLLNGPKELRSYIKKLPEIPCQNDKGDRTICTKIPQVIHVYLTGNY